MAVVLKYPHHVSLLMTSIISDAKNLSSAPNSPEYAMSLFFYHKRIIDMLQEVLNNPDNVIDPVCRKVIDNFIEETKIEINKAVPQESVRELLEIAYYTLKGCKS